MKTDVLKRVSGTLLMTLAITGVSACGGWRGLNSLPMPGTEGGGAGAYTVRAQLPDVQNIQPNSRVRVGDVTVGTITDIQRQGWHALVTMTINGDVDLPANVIARIGQTSLLGSLHLELAAPSDAEPTGKLRNGSLIPLASGATYPSTEQTLAAVSVILNGGGISQVEAITTAFSTAFAGRESDLRSLMGQLDLFIGNLHDQTGDIIAATDSFNRLVGQFADQKPVVDRALKTVPDALNALKDERQNLADAVDQLGKFAALAADSVNQTKENLVKELKDIGPVLESLANAGPALTRSLGFWTTFPFPADYVLKWFRGDYANLTAIIDLTLSRLDAGFFTGTRWEGNLTELELLWGRTVGQMPSPYTGGNPLIIPYRWDQGP